MLEVSIAERLEYNQLAEYSLLNSIIANEIPVTSISLFRIIGPYLPKMKKYVMVMLDNQIEIAEELDKLKAYRFQMEQNRGIK